MYRNNSFDSQITFVISMNQKTTKLNFDANKKD